MPPHTVKVDRTTRWGNFTAARAGQSGAQAVRLFAQWLNSEASEEWKSAAIRTLAGKNLACWCKIGAPCHADYLLSWLAAEKGDR